MNIFEEAIATLGIPGSIAVVMLILFAVLQLIGEIIEACGKVAPAVLKLRRVLKEHLDKKRSEQNDTKQTLQQVKDLLSDVNEHYSSDNITKRDEWMAWVNSRAVVYDSNIEELIELKQSLVSLAAALDANTRTTNKLFKESCRESIITFSHRVMNPLALISEEEFRRVFNVYAEYEEFLAEQNEPNGQVEQCYAIIQDAYRDRLRTNNFIEYNFRRQENQ